MGLKDTGTVNDAATAGAGRGTGSRGTPITRDPWDTGPRNPNSFFGPGQGSNYVPAKIGAYATPEPYLRNKTELKITLTPDRKGQKKNPLELTASRPAYIPDPGESPKNTVRIYVTWGTVNNAIADNWDEHFDVGLGTSRNSYFFAKVFFGPKKSLAVTNFKILQASNWDAHETPEWMAGGERPEFYVFSLGSVYVSTEGSFYINPNYGSVMVTEHVSNIAGGSAGDVILTKLLSHHRV